MNDPRPEYDIAILGAGLAGLSLAVRLAEPRFGHLRVLVLEPRAEYRRDRTWSYWAGPGLPGSHAHPFRAAIAKGWDRWTVRAGPGLDGPARPGPHGSDVTRAAPGIRYESIPADALYALALDRIGTAPHVELRRGAAVAEAAEDEDSVRITLSGGAPAVRARLAFDTRPPPGIGRHGLVQRFLGQEVETDRPAFDPGTAVLMDFGCAQQEGAARFTYVLPLSDRRALVEDTFFAPQGFRPPDHRAALRTYLRARYGVERYAVGFEETGALPMDPVFRPAGGSRLVPLGTAGGAVRPSTGYAFAAVQAQCDAVAEDLLAGRLPRAPRRRPGMVRMMDQVLLALLERRPEQAPRVFASLFARCPPAALVRFMADAARPSDYAAVATAIPWAPVCGAAARLSLEGLGWRPRPRPRLESPPLPG